MIDQAVENKIDLSVLVVGFNSGEYLAKCFHSIELSTTAISKQILFIDNGSYKFDYKIEDMLDDVRVVPSRGNVGFACGNNILASHAKGNWLLLLNPDTAIYPDAVDQLLTVAKRHPEFQALGGQTIGKNNEPLFEGRGFELPSINALLKRLLPWNIRRVAENSSVSKVMEEVDALSGGFMMVRRDVWNALDGMDEGFFLYSEEIDFFKRLKEKGGRVGFVRESKVYHDLGSGEALSPTRLRYKFIGEAHYFQKHFNVLRASICVFLMWLYALSRYAGGCLLSFKSERYRQLAKAYKGLVFRPFSWVFGYNSSNADPRKSAGGLGHFKNGFPECQN